MARRYDSFLIRRWELESSERIEVEHIQSGRRAHVSSMAQALAWIEAAGGDPFAADAQPRTDAAG